MKDLNEYYKEIVCSNCGSLVNVKPISSVEFDSSVGTKSNSFLVETEEVYQDLFGIDTSKVEGVVLQEQDGCNAEGCWHDD